MGPLTTGQRSIWLAQQVWPDVPYNIALYLEINHNVDVDRLSSACESAAAHFGTAFARVDTSNVEPVFIADSTRSPRFLCIDLRDSADPRGEAIRWMESDYRKPVDVATDELLAFVLFRVADDHCYFYLRS